MSAYLDGAGLAAIVAQHLGGLTPPALPAESRRQTGDKNPVTPGYSAADHRQIAAAMRRSAETVRNLPSRYASDEARRAAVAAGIEKRADEHDAAAAAAEAPPMATAGWPDALETTHD